VPTWVDNPDSQGVELGLRFQATSTGYVTGIRFYKDVANTGAHVVNLWTASGTLLATAQSTNESASGWQEVDFGQPVLIQAGQVYVASYFTPTGNYSDAVGYFSGGSHTNGSLEALGGVYQYASSSAFPSETYHDSNYWVDVVLTSLVGSVTPAAGATGVPTGSTVTVQFNTPMNSSTITSGTILLASSSGNSVAATVGYDATTHKATLTPSAALTGDTTYTVTVKGGSGGVAGANGNTLSADYTWSFTTTATPANVSAVSLWNQATTPTATDNPDSQVVELGVQFKSSEAGFITGLAFYKSANNTGTHVADLWSADGKLLATATFSNESASGWQTVTFSQPVFILANTTYIASYYTPTGNYADDQGFFNTSLTVGPLTASGSVYAYGAGGIFPTQTNNSSNYWVDVLFVLAQ
jgi:hypothetical protein